MGLRRSEKILSVKLVGELIVCLVIGLCLWVVGNVFNFFPSR